jgi:signal transduction histidine kinase
VGAIMTPPTTAAVRRYTGLRRRLAGRQSGIEIGEPYQPMPELQRGPVGIVQRTQRIVSDSATWRDIAWLLTDATAGFAIAIVAVVLQVYVVGLWLRPPLMKASAVMTRSLLAPSPERALALRVQQLTRTRSDALDASSAELHRIERDLHDGAQARLVAMGMSLGSIERLMDQDPEKAKLRVAEAREASAKALVELRDLVRGIHPPVLAERGLGDAIKALALDVPLHTEVNIDLPGRLAAPVESAAYFAVSEALANVAKHSGAQRVSIDVRYHDRLLSIRVTDDGHGGADLERGSGLRGIQRRLGTFDGSLALNSPQGGPTTVIMELPCALSSPKTSSS